MIQGEYDIFPIVARIKEEWKLGEDGINNLIEILEENKIKVIEIDAPSEFDGLSGYVNEIIDKYNAKCNRLYERK